MATYEIVQGEHQLLGIKCLICGQTSWNPMDIINTYCGKCEKFHEDPDPMHASHHED